MGGKVRRKDGLTTPCRVIPSPNLEGNNKMQFKKYSEVSFVCFLFTL